MYLSPESQYTQASSNQSVPVTESTKKLIRFSDSTPNPEVLEAASQVMLGQTIDSQQFNEYDNALPLTQKKTVAEDAVAKKPDFNNNNDDSSIKYTGTKKPNSPDSPDSDATPNPAKGYYEAFCVGCGNKRQGCHDHLFGEFCLQECFSI